MRSVNLIRRAHILPPPSLYLRLCITHSSSSSSSSSSGLCMNSYTEESDGLTYRRIHAIHLHGVENHEQQHGICMPYTSMDDLPFHSSIVDMFRKLGYSAPTPIQAQSWPIALLGRDMISISRTGSGKTFAFLLPALDKISKTPPQLMDPRKPTRLPTVLVLAPTREIALQIEVDANKFAAVSGITVLSLYGGTSPGQQKRALNRGGDMIIATPGRCINLIESGVLNLNLVDYVVVDEADRMMDKRLEPQLRAVLDTCSKSRQNLFFTATWPESVQHFASDYLSNPVTVSVGELGSLSANSAITQHVHVLDNDDKTSKMKELLVEMCPKDIHGKPIWSQVPKTLIFTNRRSKCNVISRILRDLGCPAGALHGNMMQSDRSDIIDMFRKSQIRILAGTDVAAGGMTVKDIEVVIVYDIPHGELPGLEKYVHWIDRASRSSGTSVAHTFFTPKDANCARELVGILERSGQEVPVRLRIFCVPIPMERFYSRRSRKYNRKSSENLNSESEKSDIEQNSEDDFDPISSGVKVSRMIHSLKLRSKGNECDRERNRPIDSGQSHDNATAD